MRCGVWRNILSTTVGVIWCYSTSLLSAAHSQMFEVMTVACSNSAARLLLSLPIQTLNAILPTNPRESLRILAVKMLGPLSATGKVPCSVDSRSLAVNTRRRLQEHLSVCEYAAVAKNAGRHHVKRSPNSQHDRKAGLHVLQTMSSATRFRNLTSSLPDAQPRSQIWLWRPPEMF